jgi:DNA transposition AAA+ family ATPase
MSLEEQLREWIMVKGLSQNKAATRLGVSGSSLSDYLAGKYPGNKANMDEKVKSFLLQQNEKSKMNKLSLRFVKTSVVEQFYAVANLALLDCEMAVCTGKPGSGKTESAKKFQSENLNSILLETDPGWTAKVLISELHKELGCGEGKGSMHDLFDDCVRRLEGSERLIIIDEAENLPYKALELVRRIHDKAKIGILLVGSPRLITNVRGEAGQFAQLYSRLGASRKLNEITVLDAKAIVEQFIPNANGLAELMYEKAKRNCRSLNKLLKRVLRVSHSMGSPVTSDTIIKAATMLEV